MSKLARITITLCVLVSILCVSVIGVWAYFRFTDNAPETLQTAHVGDIVDKDGNKYSFIEINYYADEQMKGYSMYEITFNFYTGVGKTESTFMNKG